jgi:outer membrane protein assembly factor BamB
MKCKRYLWRMMAVFMLGVLNGCNTIEHQSETLAKAPLPAIKKGGLKPIWTAHPGAGIAKGDAKLRLALKGDFVVIADQAGKVYALDRTTGKKRWTINISRKPAGSFSSGPSIIDEQVLLGTEDGYLLSFALRNGMSLWKSALGSPAFSAAVGNAQTIFVHTLADTVIALDAKTGHKRWHYGATTPALVLRRSSAPLLYQNLVVVGLSSGKLVALNQFTGLPEWQKEVALSQGRSDIQRMVDISADPVLQSGIVYVVSYQGKIAAFKANHGELLWEQPLSSYAGLALSDRTIVVPDHRGVLSSFDAIRGKEKWQQSALFGRRLSKPLCLEKVFLVGDDEGLLHWFDLQTGDYKGRISVDTRGIEVAPVLKDDHVYVLGLSGKVMAFKAQDFG